MENSNNKPSAGKETNTKSFPSKMMGRRPRGKKREPEVDKEFSQEIIDIARVTRVMAGGKRMSFRAAVAIGDGKGRVGFAVAKGADVMMAVNKAATQARKKLVKFPIIDGTIPYDIAKKFKAAKIILKRAPQGTGVKAGGSVRTILAIAGVHNIVGKILGGKNKINNSIVTIQALDSLNLIAGKKEEKDEKKPEKKDKKDSVIKK